MSAAAADKPVRGESPATPAITVTRVGVVLGADFLPDHEVTVRITRPGDSVSDYLTYTSDCNSDYYADLPPNRYARDASRSLPPTIGPIRTASCGRIWSNTYTRKVIGD